MKMLITAGPTREYVDTVRFISNASSGKMGCAIARCAAGRGHEVVLVIGPVALAPPAEVELIRVVSAREMLAASVAAFASCAAGVMTAAVCDYAPQHREAGKRPKRESGFALALAPTEDICAHLGGIKAHRVVVGFAMEDHDHRKHAEAKLRKKQCDAIVLNDVSAAGSDRCAIEVYRPALGWTGRAEQSKTDAARVVVELVESLVEQRADG